MSQLNFLWFKKKNTASPDTNPYSGFIWQENQVHDTQDSLIHCIVKGFIIFSATFGSIHGVLSEFDISYNYMLVGFFIFLTSMTLSLMHMKKWIFNLGYPVLFILFASSLIRYRILANSGFQAFLNVFNETYSAHFLLNFTRESTEIITNRYLTITTMAIFVGIFLAILVNVGIFNDMYFLTVFDFTFWPLQLGIYIGKYPSYVSLVFVFFAFFASCFLKLSGHYHFVYPERTKKYSFNYVNQGRNFIFHKSNARNMTHLCIFALVIALCFSLFGSLSVKTSQMEAQKSGPLKTKVDNTVKIMVQSGILGMFNRYEATGGISGGKLGGIRSVRPDYETDLIVTFAPYAYERMYLKSYVGAGYTSQEWLEPSEENGYVYSGLDEKKAAFLESNTLNAIMEYGSIPYMKGKMLIENVDAGTNFTYAPYYTNKAPNHSQITKESTLSGVTSIGNVISVDYTPYSASQADLQDIDKDAFYGVLSFDEEQISIGHQMEAYNNYLAIPESIRPNLESYHSAIGTADNTADQISMIRHFLYSCYEYDMSPGATPYHKDYVTYFLETQKRGYCAHFATAGTLLLRSYGIPARYVEGYVIDQINISESGKTTDYSYEEFFSGENQLKNDQVVSVEISDGNAHAWTEVYIDGFGWIPIEMTPPSDTEEEVSYSDFLSALSNLLNSGENNEPVQQITLPDTPDSFFNKITLGNSPIFLIFIVFILILVLLPVIIRLQQHLLNLYNCKKDFKSGKYAPYISYKYKKLKKKSERKNPNGDFLLPKDVGNFLCQYLSNESFEKKSRKLTSFLNQNKTSVHTLMLLTQKCLFSQAGISKKEAVLLIKFYDLAQNIF